ncbi:MAG: putative O-glycosylation ligase (exosortase A-associated) [Chlamydiales bacterium]|jgi:probable O-glycosylation ligase (exosortase A-associated)
MRDLFVSLIVLGALPVSYRRPLVGLLMFSLLAYMRLQDLAWGFARYQRWSYYVALVTFAGFLSSRRKNPIILEARTVIMISLAAFLGVGLLFAHGDAEVEIASYLEFCKIVAIALFTTSVIQTRDHLRCMVWVIAMSLGFYGVKNGLAGVVTLGGAKILQGPGGMMKDNNDFALAMVMAVPLLFHLFTSERRKILRRGALVMIPLTMITVMLTHSRGAALSLGFALSILVWRSRNRFIGFAVGACIVMAAAAFAPKSYVKRLETIQNFEEDGSAQGRLAAWRVAGRMVRENPIFGVGLSRFQVAYLDFEPAPTDQQLAGKGGTRVAHNSYFQIWAEGGTPALLMYLSLIGLSFFDIWRVRWRAKKKYHASWILSYCSMFEASLGAFFLGSAFLNRAHFDLFYHYVAIILVFGVLARKEMDNLDTVQPRPSGTGGRTGRSLRLVQAPGFRRTRRSARTFRRTSFPSGPPAN